MKKRIQKKRWKEETTAQQNDLMERVEALEELTLLMSNEQTVHWKELIRVRDNLDTYKAAQRQRQEREARYRARQERVRWEQEQNRRDFRMRLARGAALLTFAASFLLFALMLPAPEQPESVSDSEPVAVVAEPAQGVIEAMTLGMYC